VVQYEVKYQKGGNCGGGYMKLLEEGFNDSGEAFNDKTPWVVMFGPDLTCPGTKVRGYLIKGVTCMLMFCIVDSLHLPP
jgi:hypothetical protein